MNPKKRKTGLWQYRRWHELHAGRRFEADSLLLRSGNPLELPDDPSDEMLAQQASKLRSAAAEVLGATASSHQAFLDVLTDEYRRLARMGVPGEVFAELLEDVPQFLQDALDPLLLSSPEKYRVTIQYYLWYALTGPRPDRIDSEFIDRQIRTVDEYVRYAYVNAMPGHEEVIPRAFLAMVEIERNNRFIPRLKEPIWPHQWSGVPAGSSQDGIEKRIVEHLAGRIEPIQQASRLPAAFRESTQVRDQLEQQIASSARSLAGSLISELSRDHHLLRNQQPPGATFMGGGGGSHPTSGIMVWHSDESRPVPPYPWKKSVTALDSSVASLRDIAERVFRAFSSSDVATLGALSLESRGFSRPDLHAVAARLSGPGYAIEPFRAQDTNDIAVEPSHAWAAVRLPAGNAQSLTMIFWRKQGGYWLAWAGLSVEASAQPLANLLEQLRPGLELPPVAAPVEAGPPTAIASLDDAGEIDAIEPLDAGHAWRVQLAFAGYGPLSPAVALYCRATWTDPNRPAKAVPFGRYAGKHLGPVIWTLSEDGFRAGRPSSSRYGAPRMTLRGDGCLYAALLPPTDADDVFVQVYSAFDGRELARQRIEPPDPTASVWGYFMARRPGELYGVASTFEVAAPALPAFAPVAPAPARQPAPVGMTLSLEDGLFALKADRSVLPARGSRLLARWWVNGKPVTPPVPAGSAVVGYPDAAALARSFRLPATLPATGLNARRGDTVGLQLLLAPDRVDWSPACDATSQNIVCLGAENIPTAPLVSNRIDFKVTGAMLAPRSTATATTAEVAALSDAIAARDVRAVRRLVAARPRLVDGGVPATFGANAAARQSTVGGIVGAGALPPFGNQQQSALEYLCRVRPQPRYLLWWRFDADDVTPQYWQEMAEVAQALIDYGADVNGGSQGPVLATLLREHLTFGRFRRDALPVRLVEALLERGANPNVRGRHECTLLWNLIDEMQSAGSTEVLAIVKCFLDHGADVLATVEPWQRQSVFERAASLKADLAGPILRAGRERLAALEPAVRLGVEELLADLRHADPQALSNLDAELPCAMGLDWPRLGRSLHERLGVALEGVRTISKVKIAGRWAEAFLPTGRPGERAYLHVVLLRYPGGAYHAIRALLTETEAQTALNNVEVGNDGLVAAVAYGFGRLDAGRSSGGRRTSFPSRLDALVISNEQGRLAVQSVPPPGWRSFYAELTPSIIYLWSDAWDLGLTAQATWETGPRQMVMENGVLTIRDDDRTFLFDAAGDRVRLRTDGGERFETRFRLDGETLDVADADESTEDNAPPDRGR